MSEIGQCRLCFTSTNEFVKINEEIRGNFYSLTNIHLIKSNIHSNVICKTCVERLASTCKYIKILAENETRLMNENYNENDSDQQIDDPTHLLVTEIKVEIEETSTVAEVTETRKPEMPKTRTKKPPKRKNRNWAELSPSMERKNYRSSTRRAKRIKKSLANNQKQSDDEFQNLPALEEEKVTCPQCSKTMFKSNYRKHERRHMGRDNFECDMCPKKFLVKESMRNHMFLHMNIRPYVCPENCGKSFYSKHGVYFHYKMHHQPLTEFICEICAKKFKQSHLLQEHIDAKHDGVRYKCTYEGCGNLYCTNAALKKHVKSIHEYKIEPCEHCGEMFRSGFSLYQHIRINHKERKYVCEYEGCSKKFALKNQYRDHLKMHTGMKDFICNICDSSYHTKRNLTRHVQVVHQKSRFFCQISGCNASLCNKDNYRLHLRKVHAKLPELDKLLEGMAKLKPVYLDTVDENCDEAE